jgi:hypothetical protein
MKAKNERPAKTILISGKRALASRPGNRRRFLMSKKVKQTAREVNVFSALTRIYKRRAI